MKGSAEIGWMYSVLGGGLCKCAFYNRLGRMGISNAFMEATELEHAHNMLMQTHTHHTHTHTKGYKPQTLYLNIFPSIRGCQVYETKTAQSPIRNGQ